MKKRSFGDGGGVPPGGRFSEDVYARARAWMKAGSPEEKDASKASPSPAPKAASKPAPVPAPKPAPKSETKTKNDGSIPKDTSVKAPKKTGGDTSGPSNLDRVLVGAGIAGAGAGAYKGYKMLKAAKAAKTAANASKGSRAVAKSETPVKFLGASGRKNITPKEAIGSISKPKLEGPKSGDRVGMSPKPKQLAPSETRKALPAPAKPSGRGVPRMTAKKKVAPKKASVPRMTTKKTTKKNPYSK
jgi:hypothetical protein